MKKDSIKRVVHNLKFENTEDTKLEIMKLRT